MSTWEAASNGVTPSGIWPLPCKMADKSPLTRSHCSALCSSVTSGAEGAIKKLTKLNSHQSWEACWRILIPMKFSRTFETLWQRSMTMIHSSQVHVRDVECTNLSTNCDIATIAKGQGMGGSLLPVAGRVFFFFPPFFFFLCTIRCRFFLQYPPSIFRKRWVISTRSFKKALRNKKIKISKLQTLICMSQTSKTPDQVPWVRIYRSGHNISMMHSFNNLSNPPYLRCKLTFTPINRAIALNSKLPWPISWKCALELCIPPPGFLTWIASFHRIS